MPCVLYDDPVAAAGWLTAVRGATEMVRATLPDGRVGHIDLERDGFVVLLGRRGGPFGDTESITQVFVDDVTSACERAAIGGSFVAEPTDQAYRSATSRPTSALLCPRSNSGQVGLGVLGGSDDAAALATRHHTALSDIELIPAAHS